MSTEKDHARLLAALVIAAQATKREPNQSFKQKLQNLKSQPRGPDWIITVARDLSVSRLDWINRPWHCYKLKQLATQLLNQTLPSHEEDMATDLLARCCAMVEFGVDVNRHYYRNLREAVYDNQISSRELRAILRHSTVWWGTSINAQRRSNIFHRIACRLWSMGRPASGELVLKPHHWLTKATILAGLCAASLALASECYEVLYLVTKNRISHEGAEQITLTLVYAYAIWICWRMGPKSWEAFSRLTTLLKR